MELLLLFTNYLQTMGLKRKKIFPCFVKYTHAFFFIIIIYDYIHWEKHSWEHLLQNYCSSRVVTFVIWREERFVFHPPFSYLVIALTSETFVTGLSLWALQGHKIEVWGLHLSHQCIAETAPGFCWESAAPSIKLQGKHMHHTHLPDPLKFLHAFLSVVNIYI